MSLKFVPGGLLSCSDGAFYDYLKKLEENKENYEFNKLQNIGLELVYVISERNKHTIMPLSDCTLSFFTQQLLARLGVLQD